MTGGSRTGRLRALVVLAVLAALLPVALQPLHAGAASRPGTAPFLGADGQSYEVAPLVVEGADGELFLGPDFDRACYLGERAKRGIRELTRLVRVIRASGRRVLFTVAPNKTVVSSDIGYLPHGQCDLDGLQAAASALDEAGDPDYLPLRRRLVGDSRQVYWKTDPHWTTVGASVFSHAVAARLDPRLARRQRYTSTSMTAVGVLNQMRGVDVPETVESVDSATAVRVHETGVGSAWPGLPYTTTDHSWRSRPAIRTYPGRTAVIGDSFALYSLGTLRPLFRNGRFLWVGNVPTQTLVRAIRDADTVVLEVVQLFLQTNVLTDDSFRETVRRALR